MFHIYHNEHCSKSRAALDYLTTTYGTDNVTVVSYLDGVLDRAQLAALLDQAGLQPSEVIRRKESLYTELGLSDTSSEDELLDAITQHPQLLERPLVAGPHGVVLARPLEVLQKALESCAD